MTTLISASTRLEAWVSATRRLMDEGPLLNLVLSVSSPGSDGLGGRGAHRVVDAFYASEEQPPLHTIAETIFPGWAYRRRGLKGVYETYAKEYDALKGASTNRWGTYAERLIRRRTGDGSVVNPLDVLIKKMQNERETRGSKHACYELGVTEGQYDLPLYDTVGDQNRRRGLPCLSHLSFKLYDDSVHLTALYRSHDYRHKALGNLLGLARLQSCVARGVGATLGTLVVHSTYAWIGQGAKTPLVNLLNRLNGTLQEIEAR